MILPDVSQFAVQFAVLATLLWGAYWLAGVVWRRVFLGKYVPRHVPERFTAPSFPGSVFVTEFECDGCGHCVRHAVPATEDMQWCGCAECDGSPDPRLVGEEHA